MGLDELNQLADKPLETLLALGLILGMIGSIVWGYYFIKDRRLGYEERKTLNEATWKSLDALSIVVASMKTVEDYIKSVSNDVVVLSTKTQASFDNARLTMSDITTRRDTEYKEGVNDIKGRIDVSTDDIKAKIEVVPGEVGKVTEPQINTILEKLANLEESFGMRLDESSQAQIALIRTEIKAFSERMLARLEDLEKAVPEKVVQAILPKALPVAMPPAQHADTAPQSAESGE